MHCDFILSFPLFMFFFPTDNLENLAINSRVSLALVEIVKRIKVQPRYLLAKVSVYIIQSLFTHSMYTNDGTAYSHVVGKLDSVKMSGRYIKYILLLMPLKRPNWPIMGLKESFHLKCVSSLPTSQIKYDKINSTF